MTVPPFDPSALVPTVPGPSPDSAVAASSPDSTTADTANAGNRRSFGALLVDALDAANGLLIRADAADRAFASGRGGLQEMVLERAQADVMLSVAAAAASRTAQALTTILGMQV